MKKIFTCFFPIFCIFFLIGPVNAIEIIERSDWGANEEFRYIDSSHWQDILKKRAEQATKPLSESQKSAYEKQKRIDQYLVDNFSEDLSLSSTQYREGGRRFAWPVKKTDYVKAIVVHHTHSEYPDSLTGIQSIYKYHSLNNQWGDIGYHYIIGYDGEIYEGKAGGDYVIGAHTKNNNFSTVGIALMGDFDYKDVPEAQYKSLSLLIKHLVEKYGINLDSRVPMHKPCISWKKDCIGDIQTSYGYPIFGHRDAAHTHCPGENLYAKMEEIRLEHLNFTKNFTPISYAESLDKPVEKHANILSVLRKVESKKLVSVIASINNQLKGNTDIVHVEKLKIIRDLVFKVLRERG